MSEIEGISDRTPREKKKMEFDRLLPPEGIETHRVSDKEDTVLFYLDANDTGEELKQSIRSFIKGDEDPNIRSNDGLSLGAALGKKYRIFVQKAGYLVMVMSLYEYFDNPDGYGSGDFLLQTYVLPDYRQSKFVRWIQSDLFYFCFNAGIAKRLYAYMKATDNSKPDAVLKAVDMASSPCMAKVYDTDGPKIQKYISVRKIFDAEKGKFLILEMDGEIYRAMDHKAYHEAAAAPGKQLANYDEWRGAMDAMVDKIKAQAK